MRHTIIFALIIAFVLFLTVVYPLSDITPQNRMADTPVLSTNGSIPEALSKLPILFIQNQGQLDKAVDYYAKAPAQTIYFTKESIIFDLTRHSEPNVTGRPDRQMERLVFGLNFVGANSNPTIEGTGKDSAVVNYFIGNDPGKWRTDIPTYGEVVYNDIYPAIDLKLCGINNVLEYEFVVRPGAAPEDIALVYNGIDSLKIENGDLVIGTAFGHLKQDRPYIYQQIGDEAVKVEGGFRLGNGNIYGFYVASYDNRYPLIIDPTLDYCTYLGGSDRDEGGGIAMDGAYPCITGITYSSDFPNIGYQQAYSGNGDIFVAKMANGKLSYCTYLGGSSVEMGYGIAIDKAGCAYITGLTYSSDFPTKNACQGQGTYHGNGDVFVTKLDEPLSTIIYSTYLGGSGNDYGSGIAIGKPDHACVTGMTNSSDFPTKNAYQTTNAGGQDAFVAELSDSGLLYSTYLGGNGDDYGSGIATDSAGCAHITGYTASNNFPTKNAYQTTNAGGQDAFVAWVQYGGNSLIYSTYLGGSGADQGSGIAVDSYGCAYVTGYTESSNFATQNAYQTTNAGGQDAFVAKLSDAGNSLIYSTYLGGSGADQASGIAVDSKGCAYVTGYTESNNFPTANACQLTNAGYRDVFVAKLSDTGNSLSDSTYLGGSNEDRGSGIAVNSYGDAYITGYTASNNFPTKSPYQGKFGGFRDAFVASLSASITVKSYTTTATGLIAILTIGALIIVTGVTLILRLRHHP